MTNVVVSQFPALSSGTEVEVHVSYQDHWARGFEVAAVDADRYVLRRRSDHVVLPVAFAAHDVRPTR
jgi:hypothetical protein